jgi:hypothetical protein
MATTPARSIPDARHAVAGAASRRTVLRRLATAVATAGSAGYLAGCRREAGRAMIAANNDTNVKRLGTLYGFFHLRHELRGPRDEAELREFIAAQDPGRLALAGIEASSLDTLFVSERDGLPFRIRYGVDTRLRGPALPVVFEEAGRDGRRQVGFTGGRVDEVDAAAADALWSGAADAAVPAGSASERGS